MAVFPDIQSGLHALTHVRMRAHRYSLMHTCGDSGSSMLMRGLFVSTASALDDRGGTITGGTGTSVDGRRWSGCGARKGKDPPPRRGNGRLDQTFFRAGVGLRFVSFLLSYPVPELF